MRHLRGRCLLEMLGNELGEGFLNAPRDTLPESLLAERFQKFSVFAFHSVVRAEKRHDWLFHSGMSSPGIASLCSESFCSFLGASHACPRRFAAELTVDFQCPFEMPELHGCNSIEEELKGRSVLL